jgi:HNH endonuclease domain protein
MEEIWKDIVGYENWYQVSNKGNVRALHFYGKTLSTGDNGVRNLKLVLKSTGYYVVSLKGKQKLVHRLVAEAFIQNPFGKPNIDHINTITTDNRVENLRWVTQRENLFNNISHKRRLQSIRDKLNGKIGIEANKHRKVFQYSLNGEFIREWDCMSDACREYSITNCGSISACCRGKYKQSNGYIWRYELCQVKPVSLREKAILQYDKNGIFMREWERITDAAKFYNTSTGRICSCLSKITKSCKGFIWKYRD